MLRSQIAIGVGIALATTTSALAQQEPGCIHEDNLLAHVGHVMWCWDDTPEQRGLLVTAMAEGEVALKHATLAAEAADLETIRANLAQVIHALDPASEPEGEGLGYGLSLAAEGAAVHIGFALEAENSFGIDAAPGGDGYGTGDAVDSALDEAFDETSTEESSDRARAQAQVAKQSLANASAWSAELLALAQAARALDDAAEARAQAGEVLAAVTAVLSGRDLDGDGQISAEANEGGLAQAREAMLEIIAEEGLTNPYAE